LIDVCYFHCSTFSSILLLIALNLVHPIPSLMNMKLNVFWTLKYLMIFCLLKIWFYIWFVKCWLWKICELCMSFDVFFPFEFVISDYRCIYWTFVSLLGHELIIHYGLFGLHLLRVRRSRDLFQLQFLDIYHHAVQTKWLLQCLKHGFLWYKHNIVWSSYRFGIIWLVW